MKRKLRNVRVRAPHTPQSRIFQEENRELIDQITRRLLIYKYVSKVKTHAINTTKVREGAYQRTVTKVIRGIYVLMNGCETLINLFTTDNRH